MSTLPLERVVQAMQALDSLEPQALDTIVALYHPDARFEDPLHTLRSREAFARMMRRFLAHTRSLETTIEAMGEHGEHLFVAWRWRWVSRRGLRLRFGGVSRMRVRDGLIIEQHDYWDLLSILASALPIRVGPGQRLRRALARWAW